MLSPMGTPAFAAITARVPVSATTEPMERSIPPVMIVKVTPMPMMVVVLVCSARDRTLLSVKKFLAATEKTAKRTIVAPRMMN